LSRLEGQLQASLAIVDQLRAGIAQGYVTVGSGDTLQSLAAKYLGGWQEWPRLAAANGLPAGPVAVGTTLILPQRV
jgi:nucleoid-associated protein YgaU